MLAVGRNLQESRGPDLAGDEGTAEDANKEANGDQGSDTVCCSREGSGKRTKEESSNEGPSSPESITAGSSDDSNKEGGGESGNVGIGDIDGAHIEIFSDGDAHEWWKGVPGPKGNKETEPGEEEDSAIHVNDIEDGNGASLVIDWVDFWRLP